MHRRWLIALLACCGLGAFSGANAQDTRAYSATQNELSSAAKTRSKSAGAALEHIDKAERHWKTLGDTLGDHESKDNVKLAFRAARASLSSDATGTLVQLHRAEGWMRLGLYRQVIGDLLRGGPQLADGGREAVLFLAKEFQLDPAQTDRLLRDAQSGQLRAMTARLDVAAAERIVALLSAWEKGEPKPNEARVGLAEALGWHLVLQEARDVERSSSGREPLLGGLSAGGKASSAKIASLRKEALRIAKVRRLTLDNLEREGASPIAANTPPTPGAEATRELGKTQATLLAQSYAILGEGLAMHNAGHPAPNLSQVASAVARLGAESDLPKAQGIATRLERRIEGLERQASTRDFQTALVELNDLKQALQNKREPQKSWWALFVMPLWARFLAWLALSVLFAVVAMRAVSLGEKALVNPFGTRVPVAEASWQNMRLACFVFATIAPLQTLALLGELLPALHALRFLEVSAGGAGAMMLWVVVALGLLVLNLAVSQQHRVIKQNRQAVDNWNKGDRQPDAAASGAQTR